MNGYFSVNLSKLILEIGEDGAKPILSDFSCPMNADVEKFLKYKSIEFSKQGIAKTHLIFTSYRDEPVLVGYFTLSQKSIMICKKPLSGSMRRRISKFGPYNNELKRFLIGAPLIAQLGKNYANNYDKLITGNELLKLACDKVIDIQSDVGGKIVYLECENKERLIEFYSRNGFVNFGTRKLDRDETDIDSAELVQMLKYLST